MGRIKKCKICNQAKPYISTNRLCIECIKIRVSLPATQLKAKEGEYYEKWRKSMIKGAIKILEKMT